MCGICGFNWKDETLARKMAAAIAYRGPDQEGYYSDKHVSLGHKRLSFLDLSIQGMQPMFNEDKSICIIYNGEIYNFQDIKPDLIKKGHIFRSNSDTEIVIHAYEEYGVECLKMFNGMFAFAIWDTKKEQLFLARDRIGIKPLYYYHKDGKFIFASEIKSILQHPGVKRELNENCLKQMVHYEYPIDGSTLIKDVVELKPAHYMLFKKGNLEIKQYWNLVVNETDKPEEYYSKELEKLLTDSVKRMLVSDRPIGLSLSGGIDSAVLVALASKVSKGPVKTFTLGFDVPDDEYSAARKVAEYCKTEHTEIHVNSKDYIKALMKVLWHYERPFSKPAIIPVYYLTNKICQQLIVSLSGEGSDELFAGYRRYDAYAALPAKGNMSDEEYENLKKKINMSFDDKVQYVSSSSFIGSKESLFTSSFLKLPPNVDVVNTFGPLIKGLKNDGSQLNQVLKYEIETEIPYFHSKKLDTMSMASSHEVRVPYLDNNVVDFAMTIPAKYKFLGTETKIILRKIADKLLPKEIAHRKKQPMVTPISDYFEKEIIRLSEKVLTDEVLKKRGFYNIHGVKNLIKSIKDKKITPDQIKSSRGNPFRQLLFITTLELWIKLYIEGDVNNPDLEIKNYL